MLLVGLTGGIASGKSTVARRFADTHGFVIIDADQIARQVVEPGQPALAEITKRFGDRIIGPDGTLDRPGLGAIVFADERARLDLNAITHPRIAAGIRDRLDQLRAHWGPVVVDSPLLVEMGHSADYPVIVVVASSLYTQHQRLVDHRGMDPHQAWNRIDSQAPLEDKLAVATHVIHNDGSYEQLIERTDEVAGALIAGG